MIIDIHTHIFPDELAQRALSVLSDNAGIPPYTDGTCAGLLASMVRAGVDKSALMPIATKPSQSRGINSWVSSLARQHSQLIPFGTIHPLQEDWQEEIDYIVSEGMPGIKMHPDYQEFFVDDPQLTQIYKAMADAGLILLLHAGFDGGLPLVTHCTPERLTKVLDSVPNLTIIAAHMGGYSHWDDVERYLVGKNVYLDTAYTLPHLDAARMTAIIRAHGIEKILFGTDSPWKDQADYVAGIRSLRLTDDEIEAILGGNAERLLLKHHND